MSEVYKKFINHRIVHRKDVLEYFSWDVEKANAALRWLTRSGKAQRIKVALYYFKRPDEWFKGITSFRCFESVIKASFSEEVFCSQRWNSSQYFLL